MVQFANDDMESKNYDDSIVIINVSTEERDKVEDNLGSGITENKHLFIFLKLLHIEQTYFHSFFASHSQVKKPFLYPRYLMQ